MGKERCSVDGSKAFVLKFDMHCKCNGCIKKINDGVKEISLSEGVESTNLLIGTGEVRVTGRMDPEKVRSLFQAATKKCVGIVTRGTLLSPGHTTAPSSHEKRKQAPSAEWLAPEAAGEASPIGWGNGARWWPSPVTPSAPPLPEEEEAWGEATTTTVPSERCRYRWPAPRSWSGVWAAASEDVTETLAMYEL